jgi:phospholipase/carboxylesterase
MGEASRRLLHERGHDVLWKTYPMGHSLCLEEVQDISAFLRRVLGDPQ